MAAPIPPGPPPRPQRPSRRIFAEDVVSGRVSLDGFPFRYCYLTPNPAGMRRMTFTLGAGTADLVDQVLTAVELLEARGWQLVNIEQNGLLAYLRRVG